MILIEAIAVYAVLGAITALAFVTFGIARVLPAGTSVTLGARVLLWPGAALLWPYVLLRWVKGAP